ncbi:MAG: histidine--tRNA ligase [Candidatus Thorarchaeota archaeon]|nr:histidine--tRNA ligase [Candidatus Thorarchaeota archaeon]
MSELRTVRGMRDVMGSSIRVRDFLIKTAVEVFRLYGYEPLDSPVMELWETLSAKGGEEIEAETFKFLDKGKREVGLRFDLTVPLARIVASNPHLPKPFKRYAVGKAWRYDRPQAGRYREFMQADVDVVGSASPAADAEVVLVALEFARRTIEDNYVMKINNRKVLKGLTEKAGVKDSLAHECFRAIDKLDKIGRDGVLDELRVRGIGEEESEFLLDAIKLRGTGLNTLDEFRELLEGSEIGIEGVDELTRMAEIFDESGVSKLTEFDMSLARGLDYYTGAVFEARYLGKPNVGSIAGGGRYDALIERFGGQSTAATGISLGIDRIVDILLSKGLGEKLVFQLDVFIAPIKQPMVKYAMKLRNGLIKADISCEVDLMERPLKKLLEQADAKNAHFVVIVGARDQEKGEVSLRNMRTKETQQVSPDNLVSIIREKGNAH